MSLELLPQGKSKQKTMSKREV